MTVTDSKRFKNIAIGLACLAFTACASLSGVTKKFDTVIINGRVLDGTGNPWHYADIAIRDDRIVKMGHLKEFSARNIIDAEGLYIAPGFIDVHSHAGSGLTEPELSSAEPLLRQGITTVAINPDGGGYADLQEQQTKLLQHGLGVNVAQLVPHGSVRVKILGMEDRPPSPEEMEEMRQLVRDGMKAGAFGLSSGTFYTPGSYASTDELIELAKISAEFGGVYTSHIRDESNYTVGLKAAVDEVIRVAREAKLPGIITHIKALGPPVWGLPETVIANIEKARSEGVEIFADQYPYTASATNLISALVPGWAREGGYDSLLSRLKDPGQLPEISSAMEENLERRGGGERIQFRYYSPDSTIEGKTLRKVAEDRDISSLNMAVQLIKKGRPGIVSFNMDNEDVHQFMQQRWTMTSSDGGLTTMGRGVPHPRNYGAFPRKIRKYVLEEKVVDLTSAVRSMTSLPAQVFQIPDRGQIREGAKADIVIFDPEEIGDKATYQDPHQLSEGVWYVLVNGSFAIRNGKATDPRSGRMLHSGNQDW